ncbi:type VII secretion system-associated protein [Streptomyces sp. NPDC090106]|uniref:type VII secretion system-associated protein n=1 Tax=Streptomyces sp. NPDC090106 TaxID=3365946 RepID=UPI0037FEE42A
MTNDAPAAEDEAAPQDGLPALPTSLSLVPQDLSPGPAEEPEQPEDARPPVLSRPVAPEDLTPADIGTSDDPGSAEAMPAPPRHVVEAAEETPGHWFALPDPAWTGTWPPPAWTVVGEWRADDLGQLVEWRHNPDYVRSPAARGWPGPTDAIDAAVQRAAAGYGQDDEVPELLAGAEVAVFVTPGGEPVAAVAPDGTPVVLAFTSEAHLANAGRLTYAIHDVPALADLLPEDHQIYLNASAPVSMCVDPAALARAIERARQETDAREAGEDEPSSEPDDEVPDPAPDPQEMPETEPDEIIPAAVRVDTSGTTEVPGVASGTTVTEADEDSRTDQPSEPSGTPAAVPPSAPAAGSATLAESAAAALMPAADR